MEGKPHIVEKQVDNPLSSDIENSSEILERERSLTLNMNLSQEEQRSLDRIRIEQGLRQFDFYGVEGDQLKRDVVDYLSAMGENDPEDLSRIANVVSRLSEGMRKGFAAESTWTMIRVSLPHSGYEIQRWHPDGKYFRSIKKRYKLVATLKGPQTLFGEAIDAEAYDRLEKEMYDNYRSNEDDPVKLEDEEMRIRVELQKVVKQIETGGEGKAVVYLVGEKDAVLHSEPDITEPRIFVSILPGSHDQIAQWAGRSRN